MSLSVEKLSQRTHILSPLLSIALVVTPVLADNAAAQQPAQTAPPAAAAQAPAAPLAPATVEGLKVTPLAGKDEVNDIERKLMAPLVVQITDQNDRPVEGAEVIFRFPLQGPSATFPGGRTSQTTRTNSQGQAAAMNWMANSQTGHFDVHVTASYANLVGQTTFTMSNATKVTRTSATTVGTVTEKEKKNWFSPAWVKIAVIAGGAGAIIGIVLATRGGSHSTPAPTPPTVTISPGTPSVGGPH